MPSLTMPVATGVLRAVDYNRVSTEEQRKGYGIAAGLRKSASFITRKGWDHVGTYKDEGLSGSLEMGSRADFDRLMLDAKTIDTFGRRAFDVVVVPKGDRIGRTGRAFWRWVWALEDIGIFVALVDKDCDNTTQAGRSEFRKSADYAETEWETIRSRTQDGLQEKAYAGGWIGGPPPFGYEIENQGKRGESHLIVCDREALMVRIVVKALQEGDSLNDAAIILNMEEQFTRSGRPWGRENLRHQIFSDAILNGYVIFRNTAVNAKAGPDGEPLYGPSVKIPVPQFLTDDEVAYLREWQMRSRKPKRRADATYPLSLRLIGMCGKHYSGQGRSESGYIRGYRCSGKNQSYPGAPTCNDHNIDASTLEKAVWDLLCTKLGDRDKLEEISAEWLSLAGEGFEMHESRISDLESAIKRQNSVISTTVVSLARLGQSEEEIAVAVRPLNEELEQIQKMKADAEAWFKEREDGAQRGRDLAALAQMAQERLGDESLETQARFLDLLDVRVHILSPVPILAGGHPCTVAGWYEERKRGVPMELTDDQWARVAPLVGSTDALRRRVNAVLHKARSRCRWADLPSEYGSPNTARRAWTQWSTGLWAQVDQVLDDAERSDFVPTMRPLPDFELRVDVDPRILVVAEPSRRRWSPVG